MAVPSVNINIEQGADFSSTFTITNSNGTVYNLSGTSVASKIKKHSEATVSYAFSTTTTVSTGKIQLTMANSVTSTIPEGRYFYDILVTNNSSGEKTRVIEGMAIVSGGIT